MFQIVSLCEQVPVVLMHGFAETNNSFAKAIGWIQDEIPGLYVISCEVGNGPIDTVAMPINEQIEQLAVCINNDPHLVNGFIGVGYSNGGYLMRGYLEKYNHLYAPMLRFITLSSPLGGFFCGVHSKCVFSTMPEIFNELMADFVYTDFMQEHLASTAFWRDPYHLDKYLNNSHSLRFLDNSISINKVYRNNFMSVDKLVLFGSEKDGSMSPWQTAWFGVFQNETDEEVTPMQQRIEYEEDTFGLKTMNEQGRIIMIDSGLDHLQYQFNEEFIRSQLAPWLIMDTNQDY